MLTQVQYSSKRKELNYYPCANSHRIPKLKMLLFHYLKKDLRASKSHKHTLPSKLRVEFFSKFTAGKKTTSMFHVKKGQKKSGKDRVREGMPGSYCSPLWERLKPVCNGKALHHLLDNASKSH